jgi:hypothetical protein
MASITYGTLYVNGTPVADVTNLEVVSTRQAAKPPLSKPSRVEKWQRWRNQGAEYVVAETREGAFDRAYFADGECCSMYEMRASSSWAFLGYAKPDKVEVGQRWRNQGKDYVVEAVSADVANMGGISRASIQAMLTADTFEYLGMAESADGDWKTATGEVLDRLVKRDGLDRLMGETDEQLRARFSDPENAADRLRAEIHANDKCEPITNRRITLKAVEPGPGAANTRDVYVEDYFYRLRENGYEVVKRAVTEQFKKAIKTNAANVARRANEEAAKRLIANPPDWAYPKAWMCAVLAAQEWNNSHTVVPGMELSSIGWWIAVVCELEHRGRERSATIDGIETVIRDAYARGMERPSPFMGRPGVKGGISTCDLGVDYE